MKERPILFKGKMVRAIIDGSKTQTRRVMKCQPHDGAAWTGDTWEDAMGNAHNCPYGKPGDRLWAREACKLNANMAGVRVSYRADETEALVEAEDLLGYNQLPDDSRWRPSIHMPRWASRLTLEITDVRVQHLQDITEEEATAEGIMSYIETLNAIDTARGILGGTYRKGQFARLWESINGKGSWSDNPYVWVISFNRLEASE